MTLEDFQLAVRIYVEDGYGQLPQGLVVSDLFSDQTEVTESDWTAYSGWPGKPNWETLTGLLAYRREETVREDLIRVLRFQCHKRINQVYNAAEDRDEIFMRLSGEATPEQDAERERLRSRYNDLKHHLTTLTGQDLTDYDATADAVWEE